MPMRPGDIDIFPPPGGAGDGPLVQPGGDSSATDEFMSEHPRDNQCADFGLLPADTDFSNLFGDDDYDYLN